MANDFIGTNDIQPKKTPTIRKVKDYLLAAFAFPLATNVGLTFWSLMAIDRELIFPKAFDDFFPGFVFNFFIFEKFDLLFHFPDG